MSLKMDNMISVKHEIVIESACRREEEREKGICFFINF